MINLRDYLILAVTNNINIETTINQYFKYDYYYGLVFLNL